MSPNKSWTNFVLYYGYGLEHALETFDLIILESRAHEPQFIKKLNDLGRTTLAYLSGFEYPSYWSNAENVWRHYGFGIGIPWKPSWTTNYLMDLRRKDWQELLADEMQHFMNIGFRGVFLDTIGICQMPELSLLSPALHEELLLAAADTIQYLRNCFPQSIIVQNCGLNRLKDLAAPYIDAICWEGFHLGLVEGPQMDEWSNNKVKELQQLSCDWGIKTLLLAEDGKKYEKLFSVKNHGQRLATNKLFPLKAAQERFASEHGFLIYEAPRHYMSGVYGLDGYWY